MEGRPEVCELSAHSFVTAEPTSLRHFQDAAASAQDAAADGDGVAHFPLATFHSGARGSIPPPPAVRDPSALVAGGVEAPFLCRELGDSAPAPLFAGMTIETSDIGSEVSDNDQGSDNDSDGGQQVAFDSFGTLEHDSDRGASPLAAPICRPRAPPGFLRCALMSSMLCCSLLASATASLVAVGGGDRGLVEPGVTVHRSTGDLFASDPPLGSLDIRDWPPDDRVLSSLSSMFKPPWESACLNSSVDLLSAVEPPCPLGPGGAQFQKDSLQFTSGLICVYIPTAELSSADQLQSG
ncbi:hypothetical protein CYMTET_24820 [Cymbomonas tetramitiformis]|uniref:Uncharacterized protein n=1 Tax=Cymbomonas tetramitiformis TaxID=36881 RepID=A0AAE0FVJ1_9CHLO|nr:hypothetical protein CYMTET_24820 [Cymbomonas tetramitiformis]